MSVDVVVNLAKNLQARVAIMASFALFGRFSQARKGELCSDFRSEFNDTANDTITLLCDFTAKVERIIGLLRSAAPGPGFIIC